VGRNFCPTPTGYTGSLLAEQLAWGANQRFQPMRRVDPRRHPPPFYVLPHIGSFKNRAFLFDTGIVCTKNGDAYPTGSIHRSLCSGTKTVHTWVSRDQTTSSVDTIPLSSERRVYTKKVEGRMGELEETETILLERDPMVGTMC
jgi:hypothetical protein